MQRVPVAEREDWKATATEHGFQFHTIGGAPYWDERAYYRFTLKEIEDDLEDPSAEIEQMCFAVVERVAADEAIMARLGIPALFRQVHIPLRSNRVEIANDEVVPRQGAVNHRAVAQLDFNQAGNPTHFGTDNFQPHVRLFEIGPQRV